MFKIIIAIYKLLFKSLSGKFSLYILALIITSSFILTYLAYKREYDILQTNMKIMIEKQQKILEETRDKNIKREREFAITSMSKKGELLSENLGKQITKALLEFDFTTITNALTSVLRDKDIVYALYADNSNMPQVYRLSANYYNQNFGEKVFDEDNKLIAFISKKEQKEPLKDDYSKQALKFKKMTVQEITIEELKLPVYDFIVPVGVSGMSYGYIRIGFSLFEMYNSIERIKKESTELAEQEIKKVTEESIKRTDELLKKAKQEAIISGTIFIFLGIFVAIFLARKISKPINAMVDVMKKAESGDLRVNIKLNTGDELEKLGDSFNNMINNLSKLVRQVIDNSTKVNEISYTLASSASQSSASIETIANNVVEISKGASNNAKMVSITQTNTAELTNSAQIINQQVSNALKSSYDMQSIASEGNIVVENVIKTIGDIKEEVNTTSKVIDELNEVAQMIGKITETISNITTKTNTLAYNVSISAVKAGKQVKEIVEIGQQVRQLAKESAISANEINELILNIQNKARNAYKAMKITTDKTDNGVLLAVEAGQRLKNIVEAGKMLRNIISQISPLVQKQTEATLLIQKSMENIATISEQTSTGTTSVSELINEQTRATEQVANMAEELKVSANKLKEQMQQFIIN
ncbi:MAG TPA: methyl-accepting chemotaxis protein [bacterium]|nr:methyl-accepting chemotaxis protein [bacterium]